MSTVTLLPQSRPLVREDLAALPEDGHRYELIDGTLVVSAAPSQRHQRAAFHIAVALEDACPESFRVLMAPFDVDLGPGTLLQPDVLVARIRDLTERDLPAAPALVIEVLSPSTRRIDLLLKRDRLQSAGCPSYWVVDADEPALIAWELRDGQYVEVAHVRSDEPFQAELPFPVTIRPGDLVD